MALTRKSFEIVAEDLERRIKSGVFKSGDRLDTIEDQAKFYHVGRSTIREALGLLRAKGLVDTVQGGGTFVSTGLEVTLNPSQYIAETSELKHVLEVRKIIEVGAVSLAVQNRTDRDISELRKIIRQMESALGNEELSQIYDAKFHVGIATATHNSLVEKMMQSVSSSISKTIHESRSLWMLYQKDSYNALLEEHKAILDAIERQDESAAVQLLTSHLDKVREEMFEQSLKAPDFSD